MNIKIMKNLFVLALVFVLSYLLFHTVRAGLVSNFSDELSTQIISTASNHTINFDSSSSFAPAETLEVFFEQDFDLSLIDYTDIDFKDDDVDLNLGATPGIGSGGNIGVTVSGQTITFIQNDTDTVAAGSTITIAIGLNTDHQAIGDQQVYNPSVADTYKISLSGTFDDIGTISLVILNSDSFALQAEIVPTLSFILRDENDTTNANSCSLGTITSTGISQCSYRLAVETNGMNGWQVFIKTDGNFRNSSGFITNINENLQVTQGQEGYGIAVTAGTSIIEEGDFTDDDTPISTTETLLISVNSVYNYIEGELTTSNLITHNASVSGTTSAGIYNQQITYTVLANF